MTGNMLSDKIEKFILGRLENQRQAIVLQRKELANLLECAPSQITYVLNTRFSIQKGFSVESRRGNGGYIRITTISQLPAQEERRSTLIEEEMKKMEQYFMMLAQGRVITGRECMIIREMLHTIYDICPPKQKKETMDSIMNRMNWIIKGGMYHDL